MIPGAKKAHLHAAAERGLYVELPPEAGGGCARLLRSLGARRPSGKLTWPLSHSLDSCVGVRMLAFMSSLGADYAVLSTGASFW